MSLKRPLKRLYTFFKNLGPGFIAGASDDDPSGLTTYAQAGAQFGPKVFWASLWLLPLMVSVQEMAARIGMVTGEGIVKALLKKFARWVVVLLVFLVIIANAINIAANIAGMAESVALVIPLPMWFLGGALTIIMMILQIVMPYKQYVEILKWCSLSLLSYFVAMFVVNIKWSELLYHTVVPYINIYSYDFWYMAVAIIGTTISPYLIFWQSGQEVEEEVELGRTTVAMREGATSYELRKMRRHTTFGMFFSNAIMLCVMAVTASVIFSNGGAKINSMADAARALEPFAGEFATWLFAMGVLGTGLLSIPVLAGSCGYALAELFNKPYGLYLKWHQARFFYGVIVLTTSVGLGVKFYGIGAVDFLLFSAVINGFVCPLLIIAMLIIANDATLLKEHANTRRLNFWGYASLIVFLIAISGYSLSYAWHFFAG